MTDAERLPTVPVPRYLSIHWGWLLFLSVVEGALQARVHWDWLGWVNVLWVGGFVQAAWLIRVDHRSRSLFWYGALRSWALSIHSSVFGNLICSLGQASESIDSL